jgi:hypothetical protein
VPIHSIVDVAGYADIVSVRINEQAVNGGLVGGIPPRQRTSDPAVYVLASLRLFETGLYRLSGET